MRFRNGFVRNVALRHINPFSNGFVIERCAREAFARDLQTISCRDIRQRQRGCACHCSRHVGYGIMDDTMFHISRLIMGRNAVDRLDRSALINRNVDDDAAWAHRFHHVLRNETRCSRSWDEHSANN
ncbi:hypothetical protein D3C86_1861640 [compost metagenome]